MGAGPALSWIHRPFYSYQVKETQPTLLPPFNLVPSKQTSKSLSPPCQPVFSVWGAEELTEGSKCYSSTILGPRTPGGLFKVQVTNSKLLGCVLKNVCLSQMSQMIRTCKTRVLWGNPWGSSSGGKARKPPSSTHYDAILTPTKS